MPRLPTHYLLQSENVVSTEIFLLDRRLYSAGTTEPNNLVCHEHSTWSELF